MLLVFIRCSMPIADLQLVIRLSVRWYHGDERDISFPSVPNHKPLEKGAHVSKLDFAEPSVSEPQSRTNHHLARQDNTSNPSLTDEDSRVNASAHKTNTYFFDATFSSFFLHTTNSRSSDHLLYQPPLEVVTSPGLRTTTAAVGFVLGCYILRLWWGLAWAGS